METSDSRSSEAGAASRAVRLVVIDTDPGLDDAQAIGLMLAAEKRGELRVLAVTTVVGNVTIGLCTANARRVLATLGRPDIPVFEGAHCSLVGGNVHPAEHYHGEDGLGGVQFDDPLPPITEEREHAVTALVRLAREHKGELNILGLGPLTNIAMAFRMDPEFGDNIKDIYIMGGNYTGLGNVTPSGEFNFYSDPEAAYITLMCCRQPAIIASWEVCLHHGLDIEWRNSVLGAIDSVPARFFNATEKATLEKNAFGKWVTCDQVAAAVFIRPEVVLKQSHHHATVEVQGEFTKGQMVVDRRGWHAGMDPRKNIILVEALDVELYKKMLLDLFGHPGIEF